MVLWRIVLLVMLVVGCTGCLKRKQNQADTKETAATEKSADELSAMEIWRYVAEFNKAALAAKRDRIKDSFYLLITQLHDRGRLRAVLRFVVAQAEGRLDVEALQAMSEQEREDLVKQIETAVSAELANRNPTGGYQDWDTVDAKIDRLLGTDHAAIGTAEFYEQLQELIGGRWVGYTTAKPLRDGPASFAERDRLIAGAEKSIWVMSWAMYDDQTGKRAAEMLKEAQQRGVDVRVMVDGQIAQQKFADETAKDLFDAGIPVAFWLHPERPFHGMHRKMMVVDGKEVLIGGLNFGDEYSHLGVTDPKKKWRDTDAIFQGDIAQEAAYLFAHRWNYIARANPQLNLAAMSKPGRPAAAAVPPRAMLLDHEPTASMKDPILLATLKIVLSAKKQVDISNAYYIAVKPTQEVLLAQAANVPIRLHTNSSDSVDVPTLIRPIYRGLGPLHEAGVKVFLQKGTTVHSKWMVADERIGWVGSYNLHPRSYRYENETVMLFDDPTFAKAFHEMFVVDLNTTTPVTEASQVALPESGLSDFAEAFFFDQL